MFVFTPICFDVRSCFNDVIYIYFPYSNTLFVPGCAVNRTTQKTQNMNDTTTTKKIEGKVRCPQMVSSS
jgi:hypothetical protein